MFLGTIVVHRLFSRTRLDRCKAWTVCGGLVSLIQPVIMWQFSNCLTQLSQSTDTERGQSIKVLILQFTILTPVIVSVPANSDQNSTHGIQQQLAGSCEQHGTVTDNCNCTDNLPSNMAPGTRTKCVLIYSPIR